MTDVLIGTSGWQYDSWRGPFFPRQLRIKDQLCYYATQFRTTELNGVFYRTPTEEAVRGWRDRTPNDFVFAWKASKFITHWKRLSERSENSLELLESRVSLLGPKAGPILFQLPPQFACNDERLASFIKMLNPKRRYVFEFRHPAGTHRVSCVYCRKPTLRCAFPIMPMRRRHGSAPPILFTCGGTGRADATRDTTARDTCKMAKDDQSLARGRL